MLDEIDFIAELTSGLDRSPDQFNQIMESDAELVPVAGCDGKVLAITTDSIVEEIAAGLYDDPYIIGWMTVMASISDLAAVGAEPLGVLVVQHIPDGTPVHLLRRMQRGIKDAAKAAGTFVLGGDTGMADSIQTVGVAAGLIHKPPIVTRCGMQPGDLLFCTDRVGQGNAYAFSRLMGVDQDNTAFLPASRIREGRVVRSYASSCIDTSDGLIPAIAALMHLNPVGFSITADWIDFVHEDARRLISELQLPPWFFFAGPHGDFELLFSVAPGRVDDLMKSARRIDWRPVALGTVDQSPQLFLDPGNGTRTEANAQEIANMFGKTNGDPTRYLEMLQSYHRSLVS